MKLLMNLFIQALTLYIVDYLIPGFILQDVRVILITAVVIGLTNKFIKPALQIIFLPISVLTFGIGAFLLNVIILLGVSKLVPGFTINSFLTAAIASIAISLVSAFLNNLKEND